jgi:hypothetical protein
MTLLCKTIDLIKYYEMDKQINLLKRRTIKKQSLL